MKNETISKLTLHWTHVTMNVFFNAFSHLYKRMWPSACPSVQRSVRWSVRPSVRWSITHDLNFWEMGQIWTKKQVCHLKTIQSTREVRDLFFFIFVNFSHTGPDNWGGKGTCPQISGPRPHRQIRPCSWTQMSLPGKWHPIPPSRSRGSYDEEEKQPAKVGKGSWTSLQTKSGWGFLRVNRSNESLLIDLMNSALGKILTGVKKIGDIEKKKE